METSVVNRLHFDKNVKKNVESAQEARRWVREQLLPVLRAHGGWMPQVEACRAAGRSATGIGDTLGHATRYVQTCSLVIGVTRRTYLAAYDCPETTAELVRRVMEESKYQQSKGGWE